MNSDKSLRDLMSTLSHDIKNSLGGAVALNQIIGEDQRSQLDESTQKRLALIHNEYVTTDRKLTALSEYAKLFDHNEKRTTCNLFNIAQQGLDIATNRAIEHKLSPQIEAIGLEDLPTVEGYEVFWLYYFTELIYNSIQHAHPLEKARRVKILVEHIPKQNQYIIAYQDNGQALSEKDIQYAMRPFKTLPTNDRKIPHGAGLGIYRLTRVVQLQGGTFQIKAGMDSDYSGLIFIATIPASL